MTALGPPASVSGENHSQSGENHWFCCRGQKDINHAFLKNIPYNSLQMNCPTTSFRQLNPTVYGNLRNLRIKNFSACY